MSTLPFVPETMYKGVILNNLPATITESQIAAIFPNAENVWIARNSSNSIMYPTKGGRDKSIHEFRYTQMLCGIIHSQCKIIVLQIYDQEVYNLMLRVDIHEGWGIVLSVCLGLTLVPWTRSYKFCYVMKIYWSWGPQWQDKFYEGSIFVHGILHV